MSSSIKAIYDDYDQYLHLCDELGISPIDVRDDFYTHAKQIISEMTQVQHLEWKDTYTYNKFK